MLEIFKKIEQAIFNGWRHIKYSKKSLLPKLFKSQDLHIYWEQRYHNKRTAVHRFSNNILSIQEPFWVVIFGCGSI